MSQAGWMSHGFCLVPSSAVVQGCHDLHRVLAARLCKVHPVAASSDTMLVRSCLLYMVRP